MSELFGQLSPVLIIGMILGLVEFAKQLGVDGRSSLVLSVILGIVLGVGYQIAEAMPATFADWFSVVIFSVLFGLTASGLYDVGKKFSGSMSRSAGEEK